MECRELHRNELAEKYLNGHLDPGAQDDFETHILECDDCLRRVEAVQALRRELAARAHQIRAYSQVEHFRFRWKWLTVAAFSLVVCGLTFVELRTVKAPHPATTGVQSPVSQEAGGASATSASGAPATNSSRASSARADNPPVKGRNYINFIHTDSQVPRDNARSRGRAPSSRSSLNRQRARSNLVHMDGADTADKSVNAVRLPVLPQAATAGQTPAAPEKAQTPELARDETAKELFRLGTVQPPPYSFSGFAMSSRHDPAVDLGALSAKQGRSPANQARPFFRDAMDAYVDQRYGDATGLLEQAARVEPNAPDVNFYLGVCRLLQAKPADSMVPLQNALADEKSPWAQAAHFYLAKAYIQTGDLTNAEAQLRSAAGMLGRLSAEAGSELARLQAIRSPENKQEKPEVPQP